MLFMAKMKLAALVTAAVMLVGGAGVTAYVVVAAGRPAAPTQAPTPGEVTLRGQVFTQTGSNKLCDPDVYPLVMNVKTPQRVKMYFLKASDLTRQFAREVAAKGAMQVVVVGKVAKEGIYDAVTVSRIEVADAATQPAARAALQLSEFVCYGKQSPTLCLEYVQRADGILFLRNPPKDAKQDPGPIIVKAANFAELQEKAGDKLDKYLGPVLFELLGGNKNVLESKKGD